MAIVRIPVIYSDCLMFLCFLIQFAIDVILVILVGQSHVAR